MKESLIHFNKRVGQSAPLVLKSTLGSHPLFMYLTGTVPKTHPCLSQSADLSVGAEWETAFSGNSLANHGIFALCSENTIIC